MAKNGCFANDNDNEIYINYLNNIIKLFQYCNNVKIYIEITLYPFAVNYKASPG